jgi:hypothetical protein
MATRVPLHFSLAEALEFEKVSVELSTGQEPSSLSRTEYPTRCLNVGKLGNTCRLREFDWAI